MDYKKFVLLQDLEEQDYAYMIENKCVHARNYEKGAIICHAGDVVHEIGMVDAGSVRIENNDLWGNRTILSNVSVGQIFAETYAICGEPMMVDAVAAEDCHIVFVDLIALQQSELRRRIWKPKIMPRLMQLSVQKNLVLSNRIFCTTAKTIRGRLCTYLSAQKTFAGSDTFDIPFDRQALADYLNVDRTALSKELSKMKEDGLLDFHKNHFEVKSHLLDG